MCTANTHHSWISCLQIFLCKNVCIVPKSVLRAFIVICEMQNVHVHIGKKIRVVWHILSQLRSNMVTTASCLSSHVVKKMSFSWYMSCFHIYAICWWFSYCKWPPSVVLSAVQYPKLKKAIMCLRGKWTYVKYISFRYEL